MVDLNLLQAWTSGLIDGIAAINEKMLHRDLKPDNILIDGDTPKIGDFGLSKIIGAMTRSATFKGGQHILYMAPEGWKLEKNEIQIDMYAMGIVLYEIASLQYPYQPPSDPWDIDAIRKMHLFKQPKSLRELRPDLPEGFCQVVFRLMEKRARDRFASWSEVKEALEKAWDFSKPDQSGSRGRVQSLLVAVGQRHEAAARRRSEKEKQQAEEQERRQLDEFQMERLIDIINGAIAEFNAQSSFGGIQVEQKVDSHEARFRIPEDGTVSLEFFWILPPMRDNRREIRFAAFVKDSEGGRLNYFLLRTDDDLYGEWVIRQFRSNPLYNISPRREPFGLENSGEIHHSNLLMQLYCLYAAEVVNETIQDSFIRVTLDAINRQKKS